MVEENLKTIDKVVVGQDGLLYVVEEPNPNYVEPEVVVDVSHAFETPKTNITQVKEEESEFPELNELFDDDDDDDYDDDLWYFDDEDDD